MRHRKKINHLGRTSAHRKAMLSNMASSLIQHKRINTTLAKAKALKIYVEPLITKSKTDSTHSRRVVFGYLQDKFATSELFRDIAPKVGERPGGYTRIIKLGSRAGDNAELCMIELVDYNELLLSDTDTKKKTTRRSRGAKKKVAAPAETAEVVEEKTEEVETKKKASVEKAEKKEAAPKKKEDAPETKKEDKDSSEGEEKE